MLTSHVFPEGDSIGSEVALALHLRERGKTVQILNPTPARPCYRFLMDLFPARYLGQNGAPPIPPGTEILIALDVSQWSYIGPLAEILRSSGLPVVSVDHHHPIGDFGDLELIDPSACSTGEMLYHYFRWAGVRIDPDIAQALYASLMFDTGGLRLPQTTNRAVLVAADLLRHGADHASVARWIFQSESFERFDLYRRALANLRHERDGKVAWLSVPHTTFVETRTVLQDGDGILDNLLAIQNIDLCILFREVLGSGVRVTFRSKGKHDVGALATRIGGGGRPTAAGAFLPGTISEAEELVLPMVRRLYDRTMAPKPQRLYCD
ncbi:MAG: bifunctional oligoribonuclease/PAP phosphatase NrnA [Candidatus Eisenbacteria bacterium]|nr:DHH family phosphoesterase [Candidatus Eisenbacteria bacterium]